MLLLGWISLAGAAEWVLALPEGPPLPGSEVTLQLAGMQDGSPAETPPLVSHGGEAIPLEPSAQPGLWMLTTRAPWEGPWQLRVGIGQEQTLLPLEYRESDLDAAPIQQLPPGRVGKEQVLPSSQLSWQAASEGRIYSREEGWIWNPSAQQQPHRVLLLTEGADGGPPGWHALRLYAQPPTRISTEPRAEVTLSIGERRYGPRRADERGEVLLEPVVYPGETRGRLVLEDALGNLTETEITLQPDSPSLLEGWLTPVPGTEERALYLAGLRGDGGSWGEQAPRCSLRGQELSPRRLSPNQWLVWVPSSEESMRLESGLRCELGGSSLRLHSPKQTGLPSRLDMRVYPEVLSADFPSAGVQLVLEDSWGERYDTRQVELSATQGELERLSDKQGLLRAEYSGEGLDGEDQIRARWRPPLRTEKSPRSLRCGLVQQEEGLVLEVLGLTLEGELAPVQDAVVSWQGEQLSLEQRESGIAAAVLRPASGPSVVRVEAGALGCEQIVTPWSVAYGSPLAALTREVARTITVGQGRIRGLSVHTDPTRMSARRGGTVRYRLLGREGGVIKTEAIQARVSEGTLEPPQFFEDGWVEHHYRPPHGTWSGEVSLEIEALDQDFQGRTQFAVELDRLDRSVGLTTGVLQGLSSRSLWTNLELERRLPWLEARFLLRVTLGSWLRESELEDTERQQEVMMSQRYFPLVSSLIYRKEWGRVSTWGGIGMTLIPYELTLGYGDRKVDSLWGLHPPGVSTQLGFGRRWGAGESFTELRTVGLQASSQDLGYVGQLGGVALLLGHKVLW